MGVLGFEKFMKAVQRLTWVPHEPRRRCPVERVKEIILDCNMWDLFEGICARAEAIGYMMETAAAICAMRKDPSNLMLLAETVFWYDNDLNYRWPRNHTYKEVKQTGEVKWLRGK